VRDSPAVACRAIGRSDKPYGEDVIVVPSVSDEDAKQKFPKGFTAKKPYLRVTPQPNM
jgi:hypothetical protein